MHVNVGMLKKSNESTTIIWFVKKGRLPKIKKTKRRKKPKICGPWFNNDDQFCPKNPCEVVIGMPLSICPVTIHKFTAGDPGYHTC